MKVCLYGINFAPEKTGIGKYSGELAEYLASQGHEVRVITAPPYYPEWRVESPYSRWLFRREAWNGVDVFRCPLFVPHQPNLLTRLLHLVSFAFSSFFVVLRTIFWKPDAVITVVPTNFILPGSLLLSKTTGAKNWLHIQDYEIDAMFELGMASKLSSLKKIAFGMESFLLKRFDVVSSISNKMMEVAESKGVVKENISFFPNWANLSAVSFVDEEKVFRKNSGIPEEKFLVLYAGNLGNKQGLEFIPKLAKQFMDEGLSHVEFAIVGQGSYKSELENFAKKYELNNLKFLPLQELNLLADMLSSADLHLVLQKKGAADNVLPSKLTNILAVGGNALITAEADTELGRVVGNNPGVAFIAEPENFDVFSAEVKRIISQYDLPKPNLIAQNYALESLDSKIILSRFDEQLKELSKKGVS